MIHQVYVETALSNLTEFLLDCFGLLRITDQHEAGPEERVGGAVRLAAFRDQADLGRVQGDQLAALGADPCVKTLHQLARLGVGDFEEAGDKSVSAGVQKSAAQ